MLGATAASDTRELMRRGRAACYLIEVRLAAIFASALVSSCASPGTASTAPDPGPPPLFDAPKRAFPEDASVAEQASFVLAGCQGGPESACHGSGAGGMVLPDGTPSNLVDVPSQEEPSLMRVKPGDPLDSYLYRKVIGAPSIDGGRMPLGLDPLDDRSIRALAEWIDAGAPSR